MTQPTPLIDQHNLEIHDNLVHWNRKPVLQQIYREFYLQIARELDGRVPGPVVECGSGIGNLKSVMPDAIATDLFPNPWLDQTENVYALSFATTSVSSVILFDVFHHLEYPGAALQEIHRVLRPGGRLVLFEPGLGFLGRTALPLFHHESLGLGQEIAWTPPGGWHPNEAKYYAAQGNAWRIFMRGEHKEDILTCWAIKTCRPIVGLRWMMTGGFRGPLLANRFTLPPAQFLEKLMSLTPQWFAARLLVVLEKPTESR